MTKTMYLFLVLFATLTPTVAQQSTAEDWISRLRAELPVASPSNVDPNPNIRCKVRTAKKENGAEKIVTDDIAVKGEDLCFVRRQEPSAEKRVMVFRPEYCFRLHSDPKGAEFVINRIVEAKGNADYQTKTRFPFGLAIDEVLFADTQVMDVKVRDLLQMGKVRFVDVESDGDFGDLPTYEFDLKASAGNFETVTVTLIPSQHWILKRWTVKFKEKGGGRSTETREMTYLEKEDGRLFPREIQTTTVAHPPGASEFRTEATSKVTEIEWNTVDESVFTLPYYGLPDVFAQTSGASRWLNPWIWGSLVASLAIAWWLYKSRDHKKTA